MIGLDWTVLGAGGASTKAGFRLGDRGTHSSRTLMLAELRDLLASLPATASREDYSAAIVDGNVLGKATTSSRRLTSQRLSELYALDPAVPIFRVVRRLWPIDEASQPQLALLCALARDPLLRASANSVVCLPTGAELIRGPLIAELRQATGSRLNEAILDKVARNVASSWSQAGYLEGRVRKLRKAMKPTPVAAAFALWLGTSEGHSGEDLLRTPWARILDPSPAALLDLALRGRQLGLLHARAAGSVVEIDVRNLDSLTRNA